MHNTLEQMTVWGLITDASLLVQAVMLILLLASLLSWYLIIQRSAVLRRTERQFNQPDRPLAEGELNDPDALDLAWKALLRLLNRVAPDYRD